MNRLKLIFVSCVLSFPIFLSAQTSVKTYMLPDTISYIYIDSCLHNRHIILSAPIRKNNGKISGRMKKMIFFNLEKGTVDWSLPYALDPYTKESRIWLMPEGLLLEEIGKLSLLNYKDGKRLWEKSASCVSLEPRHKGLFYTLNTFGSAFALRPKLLYMDLKTGEDRKLRIRSSWKITSCWRHFTYLNDSVMCALGNDIRLLNLYSGELKVYNPKVLNLWSFPGTEARSNLLYNDSCFYMSDKEKIFCLDNQLKELWRTELPKKSASLSHIYTDSTNVYMVNYGVGSDWKYRFEGYPFVAAFDKKTGNQLFLTQISDAKTSVLDFFKMGDTQFLLFSDRIASYRLSPNAPINTIAWNWQKYGYLRGIEENEFYIPDSSDSLHYSKAPIDNLLPVHTSIGMICTVDPSDMRVVNTFPNSLYRMVIARYGGNIILEGGPNKLIIIDEKGSLKQEVAHVYQKVFQSGNHVYALKETGNELVDISL